jgi:hypothetical protein
MSTFDTKAKAVKQITKESVNTITLHRSGDKKVVARYSSVKKGLIPLVVKDMIKAEELSLKYLELGIECYVIRSYSSSNGYMIEVI